jgi:cardiolipin synthase A/B
MASVAPAEKLDVTVGDNELRLFVESAPYLDALLEDIRSATRRVWIESYTIVDDAAGRAVAEALKERAAAGVECKLLYDTVGSLTTPERYFTELRAAGVQVRAYRPFGNWFYRFRGLRFLGRFHRRDHRKITVIDDRAGYFGGMNIIDLGGSAVPPGVGGAHRPGQPPWRDVHVRLAGGKVADIAASFDDLWARLHHLPHGKRRNPTAREILASRDDAIFFFDSRPHVRHHHPGKMFRKLINHARLSITMAMAYFLPFGGVLRALLRARKRRVTVQVIVPNRSDVPLVQWASRHMYERLLRHGIRIYERRNRMLHSKAMVIDGQWSIIGSCNIDPRSLLLNLEFFAVIRSAELATALAAVCRYERRQSDLVDLGHCRKRRWWDRLLHRAAWALRRWL